MSTNQVKELCIGPTILERLVLNFLKDGAKSVRQLSAYCGLSDQDLQRVLVELIQQNLVVCENDKINLQKISVEKKREIDQLQAPEVKEIFSAVTDYYFANSPITEMVQRPWSFSLYNVNLNARDLKMLNVLLYNVESFLQRLQQEQKEGGQENEKRLIYWGHMPYKSVAQQIMNSL